MNKSLITGPKCTSGGPAGPEKHKRRAGKPLKFTSGAPAGLKMHKRLAGAGP